ncbi:MAG: DUF465 domain-containing protein [Gammaproteobacteria bacterium]|nr:DUF465 domain-containing protein [Gammaproteobacteria bacterium]
MLSEHQDIVDILLEENEDFKSMYKRHRELNKDVDKAGMDELPLSDDALHIMKKEKLLLKDKMAKLVFRHMQQSG